MNRFSIFQIKMFWAELLDFKQYMSCFRIKYDCMLVHGIISWWFYGNPAAKRTQLSSINYNVCQIMKTAHRCHSDHGICIDDSLFMGVAFISTSVSEINLRTLTASSYGLVQVLKLYWVGVCGASYRPPSGLGVDSWHHKHLPNTVLST